MRLTQALARIADDIDQNIGWQAASYYLDNKVIDRRQWEIVTKCERLQADDHPLTGPEENARRKINEQILNSYSELDLYGMGIDVEELTVAKNGWRYAHEPRW